MADNVAITAGAGTTIATDDIGGVQHQKFKVEFGASDSATQVDAVNPLPTREPTVAAATTTSVLDSSASVELLALNTSRMGVSITNTSSAVLYIKLGTGAASTSFIARLAQFDMWEMPTPIYTGVIHGIWATDPNDGSAVITQT